MSPTSNARPRGFATTHLLAKILMLRKRNTIKTINKEMNTIPVYEIMVGELDGIREIALVDEPAIEMGWIAMAKKDQVKLAVQGDKRLLIGPVLIPAKKIYRNTPEWGECYVYFTADTIAKLSADFARKGLNTKLNIQHSRIKVYGTVVESWLVADPQKDKAAVYGIEVPAGTWMAAVKIDDEEVWQELIKTNELTGFSIEGSLSIDPSRPMAMNKNENNNTDMSNTNLEKQSVINGTMYYTPAEDFTVGAELFIVYPNGEKTPAYDGTLEFEDGTIVRVEFGKVAEVLSSTSDVSASKTEKKLKKEMSNTNLEKETKLADGTTLYTPADDFTVDAELFVVDAEGNQTPAPDGEHTLEDGTVLVVASGKITEVKPKTEDAPADTAMVVDDADYAAFKQEVMTFMEETRAAIAAINASINDVTSSNEDVVEEFAKIKESVEKFAAAPGASSVTGKSAKVKQNSEVKKDTVAEKMRAFAELRAKINSKK